MASRRKIAKTKPAARRPSPRKRRGAPADPAADESLLKLDPSQAELPDMPIAIAISEWKSLATVAKREERTLTRLGIGARQVATLTAFTKRLEELERAWQKHRAVLGKASGKAKKREEAEQLKRKMLSAGEWACRHDDYALSVLARIREGSGLADTVQDLYDLASFWELHADEMTRTKLTGREMRHARALAEELGPQAHEEVANAEAAHAIELRNRCFWAGNVVAGEIRTCGRYAFSDDPARAARFVSRYKSEKSRRSRTSAPPARHPYDAPRPLDSVPFGPGDGA